MEGDGAQQHPQMDGMQQMDGQNQEGDKMIQDGMEMDMGAIEGS